MAIGFHLDDVDKTYFEDFTKELPPMGAPYHNENDDIEELPPMGAPYHD